MPVAMATTLSKTTMVPNDQVQSAGQAVARRTLARGPKAMRRCIRRLWRRRRTAPHLDRAAMERCTVQGRKCSGAKPRSTRDASSNAHALSR
jgi:hypothetical protein